MKLIQIELESINRPRCLGTIELPTNTVLGTSKTED